MKIGGKSYVILENERKSSQKFDVSLPSITGHVLVAKNYHFDKFLTK